MKRLKVDKIYIDLFLTFLKIGAFTFGGGWAMLAIIEKEVVDKYKWLTKEEYIDALAVSQSLPGILAVNISIYIGNKLKGFKGSLFAASGTILPSFVIILIIAIYFQEIYSNPVVERIFKGIRPAVVALILLPVFTTAKAARISKRTIWIPAVAALLIWLLGVSPIYVIIAAGAGMIFYRQIVKR